MFEVGASKEVATKLSGATALHVAAERGYVEMVRFLVDRGADTQATMRNGATPYDLASQHGHSEVLRFLAKFGTESPPTKIQRVG